MRRIVRFARSRLIGMALLVSLAERVSAGAIEVTAPDQTVFEGVTANVLWTIENKTGVFVLVTDIQALDPPVFKTGEHDDEAYKHQLGATPNLPFSLPRKGDTAHFRSNVLTRDLIVDGDKDTGVWFADVFVTYSTVDNGVTTSGLTAVGVLTLTVSDTPEPASAILACICGLALTGATWRRRKPA